ncbi:MAG: nuclear transport factor 2 family protein [Planctomycetota bacterium]|nr:nuclear transport factor 2 family protein [Planctomycetota bacterium]
MNPSILCIFALTCFNGFPQNAEDPPTASSASKRALAWVRAFNENKAEKLLDFYDRSGDLMVVVSSGLAHQGFEDIDKIYQQQFKEVEFFDSKAKNLKTRVFEKSAIVQMEHLVKARVKKDESILQIHIRTTLVFHLKNGNWKILGEHSSPISGIERIRVLQGSQQP